MCYFSLLSRTLVDLIHNTFEQTSDSCMCNAFSKIILNVVVNLFMYVRVRIWAYLLLVCICTSIL